MNPRRIGTNEELHTLAQRIGDALGFEWQYSDEQPYKHRAILNGPDDVGLNLAWVRSGGDRLRITSRWPKSIQRGDRVHDFVPYNPRDRPTITVAAGKSSDQIAKDIRRRLLPKYLPRQGN